MATEQQYNFKCAGVKRLMKEAAELHEPTEMYYAQPLEDNLFEWHFTVRGTLDTDFEGGIYHGRIVFPVDYPMKPPNLFFLTPNGRFELHKKICLSISGYHPETWLPSWSIRTALLALIGFLPTHGGGALGSLDYPKAERQKLAKLSQTWKCKECGCMMKDTLKPLTEESKKEAEEAKQLAGKLEFKVKKPAEETAAAGDTISSPDTDTISSQENADNAPPDPTTTASPSAVSSTTSSAPSTTTPPPTPASAPARLSSHFHARQREADSCDFSLFIAIPLFVAIFAVIGLLVARRLLLL